MNIEIAPKEYRIRCTYEDAKFYCFSLNIDGKMGWNRQHSNLEELMFNILTKHKALSLKEIVQFIDEKEDGVFQGKTLTNSLFSIIYRRERRK
jgi:hypothetical protein